MSLTLNLFHYEFMRLFQVYLSYAISGLYRLFGLSFVLGNRQVTESLLP